MIAALWASQSEFALVSRAFHALQKGSPSLVNATGAKRHERPAWLIVQLPLVKSWPWEKAQIGSRPVSQ